MFGMNLTSGLEHSPLAFYGMAASVFVVSSTVFGFFFRKMRQLVRSRRLL